tara:strand:- start:2355 stop:3668 length:1314 start_codon:yes stop_codon:yes gene_type:complete
MNIIESQESLEEVLNELNNSIVIPIYCNDVQHSMKNELSLLIFITEGRNQFHYTTIIPINHPEAVWTASIDVINSSMVDKTLYTIDKKSLMYFLDCKLIDMNMLEWVDSGNIIDQESVSTTAHDFVTSRFWNRADTNQIVPISKHLEKVQTVQEELIRISKLDDDKRDYFDTYNNVIIPILHEIEKQGLYTKDGYEYTQYNPYTTTGRPSNRFQSINYAALNKEDGSRERFVSRFPNGKLIEMDFDAYHIRLIADVLDHELPDGSVHEYLGMQYFGKDVLTKAEYNESKEISFRILYGGVPKEFMQIEFFAKVDKLIRKLWREFNTEKSIPTYLFKRPMYKSVLTNMTPQKLFNYYIQSLETESNISILSEIYKVMQKYHSKLVLYTYDSFLFDFDLSDGQIFITDVIDSIKFPMKVKHGYDYNNMTDIEHELEKPN